MTTETKEQADARGMITHNKKYRALARKWGIRITGESYGGADKQAWLGRYNADKNLNNIPLRTWDAWAHWLRDKPHDLDNEGNPCGVRVGCSLAEAVCVLKFAVREWLGFTNDETTA